jgi:hypothetical protein
VFVVNPADWLGPELLVRICATGFVVVSVAWLAARLGPVAGGILVGLPIVLAPGFFFMLREQPAAFVAPAAAGALFSLIGVQVFLGAYMVAATRLGAAGATLTAIAAWIATAIPLAFAPHPLWIGAGLFAAITVALRLYCARLLPGHQRAAGSTRWSQLIARAVAAGVLVGLVTLAAPYLGPALAGTLVAFPIGFCVILLSLNLDHGPAMAVHTAHAGLLGVISLAAFGLVLSLALAALSPWAAFIAALAASLAVTALVGLALRRGPRAA